MSSHIVSGVKNSLFQGAIFLSISKRNKLASFPESRAEKIEIGCYNFCYAEKMNVVNTHNFRCSVTFRKDFSSIVN